ncbi:Fluoroacetyl-CoA thioesterase [Colletotrichum aenigma]|uniref:Fluoroacetyl-CoA thioesterase n=1 Tax=Colletotrichum aenigma TaxID=1215731 RepID=UPI00187283ED|nr:Fluoroacetyl-CoA thioesterase [Colletotrichum aenigma]KAF5507306.1 Fluoroacetyl-CoA thioesterase [Colletotrichum aenigma]
MATSTLSIDKSSSASFRVKPTDLSSAISRDPQDEFPSVFATSRLVALMEIASARMLKPYLEPGQLSVGVTIDVSHTACTPYDALVTVEVIYRGKEGKGSCSCLMLWPRTRAARLLRRCINGLSLTRKDFWLGPRRGLPIRLHRRCDSCHSTC